MAMSKKVIETGHNAVYFKYGKNRFIAYNIQTRKVSELPLKHPASLDIARVCQTLYFSSQHALFVTSNNNDTVIYELRHGNRCKILDDGKGESALNYSVCC